MPGDEAESRTDFELRRKYSTSINSKNTSAATYGVVADLNGVKDVYVIDNPTDNNIEVGASNYPMIRNSILVSVVGGDEKAIAKTILAKAGTGCSFIGNTTVEVKDTENFSSNPPVYTVKFLRPSLVTVFFKVTVEDMTLLSSKDEQTIKDAIVSALTTGNAKARIGQRVIASRLICVVSNAVPHLAIVAIEVGRSTLAYAGLMDVGIDEFPVTSQYQINIT